MIAMQLRAPHAEFEALMLVQVLSGVVKWCWSRLQSGVVGWDSYELFKVGEQGMQRALPGGKRCGNWADPGEFRFQHG